MHRELTHVLRDVPMLLFTLCMQPTVHGVMAFCYKMPRTHINMNIHMRKRIVHKYITYILTCLVT